MNKIMNKNNKISNGTRRGIIFSLLVIFLLLTFSNTVYARIGFGFGLNFGKQFGGRVIYPKALQIQELELTGFQCAVLGSTFSIIPIGSPAGTPTDYFIPIGVYSKTGNSIRGGQFIIGKYNFKTPITCSTSTLPPIVTTIFLDTVDLFGNSR